MKEVKGLPVGVKVPLFKAKDQNDRTYELAQALKKGPVVLLFYRGQWCPICNRHLSQLQDSLQSIYNKGATVVAISPEHTEDLKKTADKTKASFTLLFDKDYKIEDAFDVTYLPENSKIDVDKKTPRHVYLFLPHSSSIKMERLFGDISILTFMFGLVCMIF